MWTYELSNRLDLLTTWTLLVLLHTHAALSQTDVGCPSNTFPFPECDQECHCLNGPSFCNEIGICTDYQCQLGYTNTPYCDQVCDPEYFGANCENECHCYPGLTCNRVNGWCLPTYQCDDDWTGPSCQIRKPRLASPPAIEDLTCDSLTVVWYSWQQDIDVGDPPILNYVLEMSLDEGAWYELYTVMASEPDVNIRYSYDVYNLVSTSTYSFRVWTNREQDEKFQEGLPSQPTRTFNPDCFVSTEIPPVTSEGPPETTTTTTTTITTTTTTTLPLPPASVGGVSVSIDDEDRVYVHWEPSASGQLAGAPESFIITYQKIGIGNCDSSFTGAPVTLSAPGVATSYELEGVEAWSQYVVSVRAINSGGSSAIVTKTFLSPEVVPTGTVQNLASTNLTAESVIFTWEPVPCAQRGGVLLQYDVMVRELETDIILQGPATPATSYSVQDLSAYTTYAVSVRYVNAKGAGPYSAEYQIRTAQTITSSIRNLTVSVDQSGRVYVHWNAPPDVIGPLTGYTLTYQKIGIGDCDVTITGALNTYMVDSSETNIALTDLDPWSKYQVKVAAVNSAGSSTVSQSTFITPEILPTGTVQNVRHQDMTSTTVTFLWDPVPCVNTGGDLVAYEVEVLTAAGSLFRAVEVVSETLRVTGMLPSAQYSITISYTNQVGRGPASTPYYITTLVDVPPAPSNLQLMANGPTYVTVQWQVPGASLATLTQFNIFYKPVENGDTYLSISMDASSGYSKTITDLSPDTDYYIKVQARNSEGWGEMSEALQVSTAPGFPEAPRSLVSTGRNETCISMAWEVPVVTNGEIIGYRISYQVLQIDSISIGDPSSDPIEIGNRQQYSLCGLLMAAKYEVEVAAGTSTGYGDGSTIVEWTEPATPAGPPVPVVQSISQTSISITLSPAVVNGGPLSGYFIVVDKLTESARRRRDVPDPVAFIGIEDYTAAMLSDIDIRQPTLFIVGDNRTYGGYWNRALTPNTKYNIFYIVASSVDGITKMGVTSIDKPETTLVTEPVVEPTDSNNQVLWIVLSILFALLLFALLALLIFCCIRKCPREKKVPQDTLKATWLEYYKTNYGDSLPKKPGIWSDIVDFNDSARHLTIYDDKSYMPDDLKVSDIQNGHPKLSFEQEYSHLPQGQTHPWRLAESPGNMSKNRFDHLLPYDHSRVPLKSPKDGYINASFIHGYIQRLQYIAAQSPFSDETIADFWTMVYYEKTTQIVFCARLQEDEIMKSVQYWPEDGTIQQYGNIVVRHVATESFANFDVRTFDMYAQGEPMRRIYQYQFTGWPDHGVPDDPIPFLEFRMKVKTGLSEGRAGPMVVHCGTGVSRTAVFIAVDSLLEQARLENCVNVYKFCAKMRRNRILMVRTLKQYIFIYDTLFEALITNYNIVGEDLKVNYRLLLNTNPLTDKSYFRQQFEILEEFIPTLDPNRCKVALDEVNIKKNRFRTIVPSDNNRVEIRTRGGLGRTDYINALWIDGYIRRREFIVTQTPLQPTVVDFWKMIYDHDVNTIVMLNSSEYKEDTCVPYWPSRLGVEKYDPFFVNLMQVEESEHVTIRTMVLNTGSKASNDTREVRLFQYEAWKMYDKVPWSRESFIQLMETVETWREESDSLDLPVVVHCMDGASQSGLYCACAVLCEKMALEGEVDVFHTIKSMKRQRHHFINSLDQYKFCFKLLWDYLNSRVKGNVRRPEIGDVDLTDSR